VMVVGTAITADAMYFNPQSIPLEHTA
jgi:hypothetical protein